MNVMIGYDFRTSLCLPVRASLNIRDRLEFHTELVAKPLQCFITAAQDVRIREPPLQHLQALRHAFERVAAHATHVEDDDCRLGCVVESHRRFDAAVEGRRVAFLLRIGDVEDEMAGVSLGRFFRFLRRGVPVCDDRIEERVGIDAALDEITNKPITPFVAANGSAKEYQMGF